jgi:hypothetical protein
MSLFLVLNSPITSENEVKLSLSISAFHDEKITLRTLYTAYCEHCILYTLCTAIFQDRISPARSQFHLLADHVVLNSLHSSKYKLTNQWSLSDYPTPLPNGHLQIQLLHLLLYSRSILSCKCISNVSQSQPPSASPNSLDPSIQVHF